jgi:transcriptional regulator
LSEATSNRSTHSPSLVSQTADIDITTYDGLFLALNSENMSSQSHVRIKLGEGTFAFPKTLFGESDEDIVNHTGISLEIIGEEYKESVLTSDDRFLNCYVGALASITITNVNFVDVSTTLTSMNELNFRFCLFFGTNCCLSR